MQTVEKILSSLAELIGTLWDRWWDWGRGVEDQFPHAMMAITIVMALIFIGPLIRIWQNKKIGLLPWVVSAPCLLFFLFTIPIYGGCALVVLFYLGIFAAIAVFVIWAARHSTKGKETLDSDYYKSQYQKDLESRIGFIESERNRKE